MSVVPADSVEPKVLVETNEPTSKPEKGGLEGINETVPAKTEAKENMASKASPSPQNPRRSKQFSIVEMMKRAASKRRSPSQTPPKKTLEDSPADPRSGEPGSEGSVSFKKAKVDPAVASKEDVDIIEIAPVEEDVEIVEVGSSDDGNSPSSKDVNASSDTRSPLKTEDALCHEPPTNPVSSMSPSVTRENAGGNFDDSSVKGSASAGNSPTAKEEGEKNDKPSGDAQAAVKKDRRSRKSSAGDTYREERRLEKERKLKLQEDERRQKEEARKHKEEEKKLKEEVRKQKEEEKKQKEEVRKQKEEEKKQKDEERKRQLEEKERKKREKEEQKEQKEKERREKEEQKEKERMEKEAKLKAKEIELRQKEEEKRKQEEAKQKEQEAKIQKQQKQKQAFAKFFVKVDNVAAVPTVQPAPVEAESMFKPFPVKENMRLAPLKRADVSTNDRKKLDELLEKQICEKGMLYLNELRRGVHRPKKSVATFPPPTNDDGDDVQVIEDDQDDKIIIGARVGSRNQDSAVILRRAKLFQFDENRRPPYWGTWRKKSSVIRATKPFLKDTTFFDYDVDSDDEWEEEEENAENLEVQSDEDKESEDDYEIDNEFFVPHGYLSDGEGDSDDDAQSDNTSDPSVQEKKLKLKAAEFEEERKQKTTRLHPILIGPLWHGDDEGVAKRSPNFAVWITKLKPLEGLLCAGNPGFVYTSFCPPPSQNKSAGVNGGGGRTGDGAAAAEGGEDGGAEGDSHASGGGKRRRPKVDFPEDALGHLVKLLHGRTGSKHAVAAEFIDSWVREAALNQLPIKSIPKVRVLSKIKDIAGYDHPRACWTVKDEILAEFPDVRASVEAQLNGSNSASSSTGNSPNSALGSAATPGASAKRSRKKKLQEHQMAAESGEDAADKIGSPPSETPTKQPRKSGPMDVFLGKAKSSKKSQGKKLNTNTSMSEEKMDCDDIVVLD